MAITINRAISYLADNVAELKKSNLHENVQRRNQVVDLFGVEFTAQGATGSNATFYISISPDLIYYSRFEFKLIIQPFIIPISGSGVNPTSLTARTTPNTTGITGLTINNNEITPNPHTHEMTITNVSISPNPHSHTVSAGITTSSSTFSDLRVLIEGIDITSLLRAQYGGQWITEEGLYPNGATLDRYDILEAVGHLTEEQRNTILKSGYKRIEIQANGVFNVTLVNYLKYSHVGR